MRPAPLAMGLPRLSFGCVRRGDHLLHLHVRPGIFLEADGVAPSAGFHRVAPRNVRERPSRRACRWSTAYPLIALFQAPLGDFDPLGEPDIGEALGVFDELVDDLGPVGYAGEEWVEI